MPSFHRLRRTLLPTALLALATSAGAQDLSDLKQLGRQDLSSLRQLGGESLGSLGDGSTAALLGKLATPANRGNAAGLLSYCIRNKYLGAASGAGDLKDRLLRQLGGEGRASRQDVGYQQGLQGILRGSDGRQFDLGQSSGSLRQQLSDKVCQLILKHGAALL